jgi:matrixin
MMKIERLLLGLALVAVGVFGSPSSSPSSAVVHGSGSSGGAGAVALAGSQSQVNSACGDGAFVRSGHRWSRRFYWYFQGSSRPRGSVTSRVAAALVRAANNITSGRNNCGLPDLIGASHSYRGSTSRAPNIGYGAWCGGRDGRNVVGFGTLPYGYLGMTCWWTYAGRVVETDIKLNKAHYAWFITRRSWCRGKWSIEAAATHEFGHAFGLGHVSEYSHGSLTMSPMIRACQDGEKTLGLGDVLGLRSLY